METLDVFLHIHNMKYEITNTLITCLPPYQKEVSLNQYNIYIIDNDSTDGLDHKGLESMASNITFIKVPFETKSPAVSLNWAISKYSRSNLVMVCIDGARMFSDQVISKVLKVFSHIPNAFVYTVGFHIGEKTHMELSEEGYSIENARQYLNAINWRENPKLLFEHSVYAGSSRKGYFAPLAESNAFTMSRKDLLRIGIYNPAFTSPGGGYCNLEIFSRYTTDQKTTNVCLLNEGTFHQFHDGVATSNQISQITFQQEYEGIFGKKYITLDYDRFYF